MVLTKAIVKRTCDTNSNYYFVYIPLLRKANDSEEDATLKAVRSTIKGMSDDLRVGDVVYVSFEDTEYGRPVILGKLYTGDEEDISSNLILRSLRVTDKVVLPGDTVIGDLTLDKLKDLVYENTNNKQERLVSGENIKTINNISLLGSGNITIQGGGEPDNYIVSASVSGNNLTLTPNTGNPIVYNHGTVNWGDIQGTLNNQTDLQNILNKKMSLHTFSNGDVAGVEGNLYTLTSDFRDIVIAMDTKIDIPRGLFFSELDLECYPVETIHMDEDGVNYYLYLAVAYTYLYAFRFKDENGILTISTNDLIPIGGVSPQYYADENQLELGDSDAGYNTSIYGKYLNNTPIFGPDYNYKWDSDYYNLAKDIINRTYSVLSSATEYTPDFVEFNKELYAKVHNLNSNNYYYSKIAMSNYYHEPRFNSGLSIASSSNVSEIYVPYATSSTYGVIQDLYSNYLPLSGGTLTGSLTATEFTISNNKGDVNFYLDNSGNLNLWLGHNSAEPQGQTGDLQIPYDIQGTVITEENVSLNYVPYSGASKAVNLGANSFYAENIYGNNIGLLLAGTTFQGFNFYDGDVNLYTGGGPLNIYTNSGGVYYDGNEVATVDQIPSVYNATLTLQKNGTNIGTFTANASNNSTININLSEYATVTNLNNLASNVYFLGSDVSALSSSLSSYATQSWVLDKRYVSFDSSTSAVNIGNGTLYAGGVDLYSQFSLTPDENGTYLITTYGNTYIDNDIGDINLRTSSGKVYYNGSEVATTNYVDSGVQYAIAYTLSSIIAALGSYATKNWVSTNSFASFHTSSLYVSTIITSNRTLNGVYTKSEALAILNGTSSVS